MKPKFASNVDQLRLNNRVWEERDLLKQQLKELFQVTHPWLQNEQAQQQIDEFIQQKLSSGNWIYFPWNGALVHIVNEEDYYVLRTNRNKNLITATEQDHLYNTTIGIVGLSIGSHLAMGLVSQCIGKTLKLAEFDSLESTNLNRMRATIKDIGRRKIDITTEQLYDLNPYLNLIEFSRGLNPTNLDNFINSDPKPKLIFELIDDFEMKIRLREAAKKAKVPVISYANLGDTILVDIERFDQKPDLTIFNGLIGNLPEKILLSSDNKNSLAVSIVGIKNIPPRALESVKEIGKSLTGRPQLSSTVSISAALGVFFSRRILLDQTLPSGRSKIELDHLIT